MEKWLIVLHGFDSQHAIGKQKSNQIVLPNLKTVQQTTKYMAKYNVMVIMWDTMFLPEWINVYGRTLVVFLYRIGRIRDEGHHRGRSRNLEVRGHVCLVDCGLHRILCGLK